MTASKMAPATRTCSETGRRCQPQQAARRKAAISTIRSGSPPQEELSDVPELPSHDDLKRSVIEWTMRCRDDGIEEWKARQTFNFRYSEEAKGYGLTPERVERLIKEVYRKKPSVAKGELEVVWGSSFVERETSWLWRPRIPYGHITVIDGDPDLGKSTLTLDLVARATTGAPFPGERERRVPTVALVISAEDAIEETIVPRLRVAGADLDKVGFFKLQRDPDTGHVVPLSIPEDLSQIEATITQHTVGLVIIDPIAAYWSEDINSHNDASVRKAMAPLTDMAQRTGAAVVLVRHLNKSGDAKAMYRGGGSIAIVGAARSGLLIAEHPDDSDLRLLVRVKGNLQAKYPGWSYRLLVDDGHPRIEWLREEGWSADDVLRGRDARKDSPARDAAEADLRDVLATGPQGATDVKRALRAAGHNWSTVTRAADRIRVRKHKEHDEHGRISGWTWELPEAGQVDWVTLMDEAGVSGEDRPWL